MIKPSEQTTQQIERFLKKIAQKFPANDESAIVCARISRKWRNGSFRR